VRRGAFISPAADEQQRENQQFHHRKQFLHRLFPLICRLVDAVPYTSLIIFAKKKGIVSHF
jgi:hypothetical protein